MGTKRGTDRVYNATMKPSFGRGKERGKTETFWKALFHQLVERQGFLEAVSFSSENGGRSGTTYRLTRKGRSFLQVTKEKLPMSFTPSDELATEGRRFRTAAARPADGYPQTNAARHGLSEEEQKVHALLLNLRKKIADRTGEMPYNVMGGAVVRELSKRRPVDLATLTSVGGMGETKINKYGAEIIEVLKAACADLKLESNVAAAPVQEAPWLTTSREDEPLTSVQQLAHEAYMRQDSLTLEQVAARMPRPVAIGTFAGHLAACLQAGLTFAWDRRRLGIDLDLELKILDILDGFKQEGHDPLASGFRLKPIFERLPPGTESKTAYSMIRLVLARLRFESGGGRLPGSGGEVLRPRANAAAAAVAPSSGGKKRALPSWAGGAAGGTGAPPPAKRVSPPKAASVWSPASRNSGGDSRGAGAGGRSGSGSVLFTPSYATTPSPQASSASSSRKLASSAASTKVFTPPSSHGPSPRSTASSSAAAGAVAVSPPTAAARLFTPSYAPSASVSGKARRQPGDVAVADVGHKPQPWTPEVVLRLIKEAGPSGATFETMVSANPGGNEKALRTLLDSMQEDFVLFTKPAGASGGAPTFLAL
ncbi:unnamed protein product [Ectocarpus sp. CCAP 1310/34]|nr:unnamed protein product [Ectocarpus sp. CCAP 1310/34]